MSQKQKERKKLKIPDKPFELTDETLKEYNDFIKDIDSAHEQFQNKKVLKVNVNSFQPSPEVISYYMSFLNESKIDEPSLNPIQNFQKRYDKRAKLQRFLEHVQAESIQVQLDEEQNDQIEDQDIMITSQQQCNQGNIALQKNQTLNQAQDSNTKDEQNVQQIKPVKKPLRNPFKQREEIKEEIVLIKQEEKNNAEDIYHKSQNDSKWSIHNLSLEQQKFLEEFQSAEPFFPSKLIISQFSPIRVPSDSQAEQSMGKGKHYKKSKDEGQSSNNLYKVVSSLILSKRDHYGLMEFLKGKSVTREEMQNVCLRVINRSLVIPPLSKFQVQKLTKFQVNYFQSQLYHWGMISAKLTNLQSNLVQQNLLLLIKVINKLSERSIYHVVDDCQSDFVAFVQTEQFNISLMIILVQLIQFNDSLVPIMVDCLNMLTKCLQLLYCKQIRDHFDTAQNQLGKVPQDVYSAHENLFQQCQQLYAIYDECIAIQCEEKRKNAELSFDCLLNVIDCQHYQIMNVLELLHKQSPQTKQSENKYVEYWKKRIQDTLNELFKSCQQDNHLQDKQLSKQKEKQIQKEESKSTKSKKEKHQDDKKNQDDFSNKQTEEKQNVHIQKLTIIQMDMEQIDQEIQQYDDLLSAVSVQKQDICKNGNNCIGCGNEINKEQDVDPKICQDNKQDKQNPKQQKKSENQNQIKTQQQRTDEAKQKKWDNILKQKELEEIAKQVKHDRKLKKGEIQCLMACQHKCCLARLNDIKQDLRDKAKQIIEIEDKAVQNLTKVILVQNQLNGKTEDIVKNEQTEKTNQTENASNVQNTQNTQNTHVPKELSKRQQKKLAREKAKMEQQFLEQQQREQFEKERQPQPYTVDKLKEILQNTKYDEDIFNFPQWTRLLDREPKVETLQKQKLMNYKKIQQKQTYNVKQILKNKSQNIELVRNQLGQIKIIRYSYCLSDIQKLKEFRSNISWFLTYINRLTPTVLDSQEIILFLNQIHPSNFEKLFEQILKFISIRSYLLGVFVELLMQRIIHESSDQYALLALKLKGQLNHKDKQQEMMLNKSYILLLQQTLSRQLEIFIDQETLPSYIDNYTKTLQSFWDAEIVGEQYISDLLIQIIEKIEKEGEEYQIIILIKTLNRVGIKYRKFVEHFYSGIKPQAIQLDSRINLLTIKDLTDRMNKCIPKLTISQRCQILIDNLYQDYYGNKKGIIADDIMVYKWNEGNNKEKYGFLRFQDDQHCHHISSQIRQSFNLDYEEQYQELEELLISEENNYISQCHFYKELFYQILQKNKDEMKNSCIIYKLVNHKKTILSSVEKGSYQALELLRNQDLYHPKTFYNLWKGVIRPFLDKFKSYELSHICLLIDPANQEQDYYFNNLTLDLIMDLTKTEKSRTRDKIRILLDYKEQYYTHKMLIDMAESLYMTGKAKLEQDNLLQARLFERILILIFDQNVRPTQLVDVIQDSDIIMGAFRVGCSWAFDHIDIKKDEFQDVLYELLYILALNDLFEVISIIGLDRQYDFILDKLIRELPDKKRQLLTYL